MTASQSERRTYGRYFIWADKIALALALLVAIAIFAFWALVVVATGMVGANHIIASVGYAGLTYVALWIGALWLLMRGLDFIARRAVRRFSNRPITALNNSSPSQHLSAPMNPLS